MKTSSTLEYRSKASGSLRSDNALRGSGRAKTAALPQQSRYSRSQAESVRTPAIYCGLRIACHPGSDDLFIIGPKDIGEPIRSSFLARTAWNSELKDYESFKHAIKLIVNAACVEVQESGVPDEYSPSDELVSLVRESLERDWIERLNRPGNDEQASQMFAHLGHEEFRNQYAFNEAIRSNIISSVVNFLSTIGRGLARGEESSFPLSANGELTEVVLKGFLFRIPVGLRSMSLFSKYIFKDLLRAAQHSVLDNQYAKLSVVNNELVLNRKKIAKKPLPSGWKKATVFVPE